MLGPHPLLFEVWSGGWRMNRIIKWFVFLYKITIYYTRHDYNLINYCNDIIY